MSIFDHCHRREEMALGVGRQIPIVPEGQGAEARVAENLRDLETLSLLAHAVRCPGCRIRVRTIEGNEVPGLRGERDASTLYVDKPESWILCDEGRTRLERSKA